MMLRLHHTGLIWRWRLLQPEHDRFRQSLQAPLTPTFSQRLQGGWPSMQVPTLRERDQRRQFIADQAPNAPHTPASFVVQTRPFRPTPPLCAALNQTGVKHLALQPDLPQDAACTRPHLIQVQQALVAFKEQFDLPAATVQLQDRLSAQDFWRDARQDQYELGQKERRLFGRVFAACAGTTTTSARVRRRLLRQPIGMRPDAMTLTVRGFEKALNRARLTRFAISQDRRHIQGLSVRILERNVMRVIASDDLPATVQQVSHAAPMTIAAIGQDHLARPEREVTQSLARLEVSQLQSGQLQARHIHQGVQAPSAAFGRRADFGSVERQQPHPERQRGQIRTPDELWQQGLQPRQTSGQSLTHGLPAELANGGISERQIGRHLALAVTKSGKQEHNTQELLRRLNLARSGEGLELTRQAGCFRRQVL